MPAYKLHNLIHKPSVYHFLFFFIPLTTPYKKPSQNDLFTFSSSIYIYHLFSELPAKVNIGINLLNVRRHNSLPSSIILHKVCTENRIICFSVNLSCSSRCRCCHFHPAIALLICSIIVISAGSQSTESSSSLLSHFAASCSFRISSPSATSAQKQSMLKWNSG